MSDIVIYTTDDGAINIDLRLENGTVWLSQRQIAELFQTSKQNISKHIQTIYDDSELDEKATVNQQLTVQKEDVREVSRSITRYNPNLVLAVGYCGCSVRVGSDQPFAGLSNFKGKPPSQAEAMVVKKYQAKTRDKVEKDYLETIATLEKQAKKVGRKK